MELRHINALIRYHLGLNPSDLIREGPEGDLDFDEYAEVWAGLEWVLIQEGKMKLK